MNVGIQIVVGFPGGGKTLFVIEQLAYIPGKIAGNIRLSPLHPAYHRYIYIPSEKVLEITMDDKTGKPKSVKGFWEHPWLERNCTIVIDEADIYFDCEEHKWLRPYIHRFLKQHRKHNIKLIFIVQCVDNIYVRIRRLAQDVVLCQRDSAGAVGWLPKVLQRFVRVRYPSVKMATPTTFSFMLEWRAKEIYTWYDTNQLI